MKIPLDNILPPVERKQLYFHLEKLLNVCLDLESQGQLKVVTVERIPGVTGIYRLKYGWELYMSVLLAGHRTIDVEILE